MTDLCDYIYKYIADETQLCTQWQRQGLAGVSRSARGLPTNLLVSERSVRLNISLIPLDIWHFGREYYVTKHSYIKEFAGSAKLII